MGAEHDVVDVGTDLVGAEAVDGVVDSVESPARLTAAVVAIVDFSSEVNGEHARASGFGEVEVVVAAVDLAHEFEDLLATCGAAGEVDLDGVRSSEYEPAPGVDADADPPAPEDLGESAETRRVLVQHLRVAGGHALNTTPRSGMRR